MYSLVIPVYKNEGSIADLLNALEQIQAALDARLEVVFVVDGSPDRCHELLQQGLPKMGFASQLLLHSRNYGSLAGIRSGLQAAKGEYFAVMAADLQEPPELVLEFFRSLRSDECDVAIGARESREDPPLSRFASRAFWWFYRRTVIADIPEGGVDMFACNRPFRQALLKFEEGRNSLIGLLFWLGFRRKVVSYRRRRRRHGKTAWTLHKKLDYLMDSVFAFSDLPIKILIAVGGTGLLFSVCFALLVGTLRITGGLQAPGYAATVITILFLGSLNLMGLGIVGAYIWRTYGNTQGRPAAVVMRADVFSGRRSGPMEQQPSE